ncbi:MAG: DUF2612 domain-containing protein [Gammaproteobacteria bacterium]|nr:DUF2612 domain-containing protein [Gammaproteobacteria bacterium]MBU0771804.1 DUF2612 domain-containing protein [Gammaproteobacteria bacterium]MBU0855560.1 DUF2612 domain-containing protein [Gammaproteobacteria bacterium]MBU1846122.1 DUF2612 domain-containing protein [Gammaproteobacteria bacterium]
MARDYTALITSEHRKAPRFVATVQASTGALAATADATRTIPAAFDVETAAGAQLDIIGLWVGQSRLIPNVLLLQFFGFADNPAALPFGEESNPSGGGRWYEEGEDYTATTVLGDPEFRTLILARIARNMSKGTTQELLSALSFIFGGVLVALDDPGDMTISVAIGRYLTLIERAIIVNLDILPRPAGVRISRRLMFDSSRYFGFEGQANALSFGEEGLPNVGGLLAEEF